MISTKTLVITAIATVAILSAIAFLLQSKIDTPYQETAKDDMESEVESYDRTGSLYGIVYYLGEICGEDAPTRATPPCDGHYENYKVNVLKHLIPDKSFQCPMDEIPFKYPFEPDCEKQERQSDGSINTPWKIVYSTYADKTGHFEIEGMEPGNYTIFVPGGYVEYDPDKYLPVSSSNRQSAKVDNQYDFEIFPCGIEEEPEDRVCSEVIYIYVRGGEVQ